MEKNKNVSAKRASLDIVKNNRNRYCGNWVLGTVVNLDQGIFRYARMNCKCWGCAYCAPVKALRLRTAISAAAVEYKLNKLLTLTLDPSKCAAEDSASYIKSCWGKFRVYLGRLMKERTGSSKLPFVWVLEFQNNGYAHLHVLLGEYIEHPWIKAAWQAVGGGRIVDIRTVDILRIPNYLSKYLTKNLILSTKGKLRRYSCAREIKLFAKNAVNQPWELIKRGIKSLKFWSGKNAFNEKNNTFDELISFDSNKSFLFQPISVYSGNSV